MPRKVSVVADLDAARYLAQAKLVEKSTAAMDREMEQLDRSIDEVERDLAGLTPVVVVAGQGIDELGDQARGTAGDFKLLETRIDASKKKIRELGLEFARTGDAIAGKDLSKERSLLGKLEKLHKELADLNDESSIPQVTASIAGGGGGGLLDGIPRMGGVPPAVLAGGVALGVALAPPLAAAISGAILGGVGVGGVVGGAVLAARDPRVKAAWKQLGDGIMHELKPASEAFVGPVTQAAFSLKKSFDKSGLADSLAASSDLIEPLTKGLGGFIEKLGPGISAGLQGARPIFDMLGEELPEFGQDLTDSLEAISAVAPSAARGLGAVIDATGELTKQAARAGAGLTALNNLLQFPAAGKLLELIPIGGFSQVVGTAIEQLSPKVSSLGERMTGAGDSAEDMANGLKEAEGAAIRATAALQHMNDVQLGSVDNAIAFEQSLDDLAESLKVNGTNLDINGQKGRDNMKSFQGAVKDAQKARDDLLAQGKIEEANAAYQRMVARIRDVMIQAGLSKSEIDKLLGPHNMIINVTYKERNRPKFLASNLSEPAQDVARRAGGGPLMPGVPYLYGEKGPEIGFFGPAQGRMLSTADSKAWAGGAAMSARPLVINVSGRATAADLIETISTEVQARGGRLAVLGLR